MIVDLPADSQLDDLARLVNLDMKNFNEDQLGADVIRDQKRANEEVSSDKCANIPEDSLQKMLAAVSTFQSCHLQCD